MTGSQRIALNALATFSRSVLGMALGLFSSRWVLQALGPVDYGLMGVVGALITFIAFLGHVTAASSARYFAFSIGKGELEETRKWFNTALSLHLTIPFILILIGWPLGEMAITHQLNIPLDRLPTARWVFRFSLISALWSMCATPYFGMFTAKQRIAERSAGDILISVANFCFFYSLTRYRGDAWLLYSGGIVAIAVAVGMFQVIRARLLFPECRIHLPYWWDRRRIREVLAYSGWNLFGGLGSLLRSQGSAILLNRHFNPLQFPQVNASYGVGGQVSRYTQTMSASLLQAFIPEITSLEGRGDRIRMLRQSNRASKFGTYLVMLFAIPVMLEADLLLALWLKEPPPLAAAFCRLMLITFLLDKITFGHMVAVSAKGQIAGYQMMLGGLMILTLPLAWGMLRLGGSATAVGWAFVITKALSSLGRLFWARYLVGASINKWVLEVFIPCATVMLAGLAGGYVVLRLWPQASIWRLCAVTGITLATSGGLGWTVFMDRDERRFVAANFIRALQKCGMAKART
ncbi:MAG: hypothetical protein GX571_10940 [Lentisphaerae bacterium]|nr:hypothetical protein [Lentisphaerota bacterium]